MTTEIIKTRRLILCEFKKEDAEMSMRMEHLMEKLRKILHGPCMRM